MKYLEVEALEALNSLLSHIETSDSVISGRVEAYSCKSTNIDRKLKKAIDSRYTEDMTPATAREGSPDPHPPSPVSPEIGPTSLDVIVSPFGPLYESTSRKTLFYLLATLNAAYSNDYDFSDVKPDSFAKLLHSNLARARLASNLAQGKGSTSANVSDLVWSAIDETINVAECDVYEFRPEEEGTDPYGDEAVLWSFHYFFFNRKMKRIVYLTARAISPMDREHASGTPETSAFDWDDMDDVRSADAPNLNLKRARVA
ncbi:Maf1 regulator-domain-containing protein [Hyaloraphidium curvatum]|nr:Maf1 regulator-domain-containing protein [Hyaloraphidium curvatum]